jgi:protein-S-isoprenylcysteine O-methyltransferase Ste14
VVVAAFAVLMETVFIKTEERAMTETVGEKYLQ